MSTHTRKTPRAAAAGKSLRGQFPPGSVHTAVATLDPSAAEIAVTIARGRDQLRERIAEAAYYRAQARGFASGHELEDWLAAEADIAGQ